MNTLSLAAATDPMGYASAGPTYMPHLTNIPTAVENPPAASQPFNEGIHSVIIQEAARSSFLSLPVLLCDFCKDKPASVLSFADRKVLCIHCDTLINGGKMETDAPRFRLEAKCLPRVIPLAHMSIPATEGPGETISVQGSVTGLGQTGSTQLIVPSTDNSPAAEDLLDLDLWPGYELATGLNLKSEKHTAGTRIMSRADSGECDSLETQDSSFFSLGGELNISRSPGSFQSAESMETGFSIQRPSIKKRRSSSGATSVKAGAVLKRTAATTACSPQRPKGHGADVDSNSRQCVHCGVTATPQWRAGPLGQKTLCNACGVRYKAGRLAPVVAYPPPGYTGPVSAPPPPSGRASRNHSSW